jgi:hypothetical protein
MDTFLFGVLLLACIILLIINLYKKQIIFGVLAGIFFLILGTMAWNGLEYVSSKTVTLVSDDVTIITSNYSTWNHSFGSSVFTYTNVLGTIFILLGLWLLVINAVMIFDLKQAAPEEERDSGEED